MFVKDPDVTCVLCLSSAQSDRSAGRRQGPGPGPGPGSAAEDHGPGCQPTGDETSCSDTAPHPDVTDVDMCAVCPQYVWERMMGGFKHKNNRTREGMCLCLVSTLNV